MKIKRQYQSYEIEKTDDGLLRICQEGENGVGGDIILLSPEQLPQFMEDLLSVAGKSKTDQ